ncbi:hypothetical protein CASFOL_039575 [Castilleja foliolosa]|uniref:Uncharacterized protein n=1 Tax=Castilleja foliolosa TaxID=1961234 RepID=A0ABD3BFK6_9LAMI
MSYSTTFLKKRFHALLFLSHFLSLVREARERKTDRGDKDGRWWLHQPIGLQALAISGDWRATSQRLRQTVDAVKSGVRWLNLGFESLAPIDLSSPKGEIGWARYFRREGAKAGLGHDLARKVEVIGRQQRLIGAKRAADLRWFESRKKGSRFEEEAGEITKLSSFPSETEFGDGGYEQVLHCIHAYVRANEGRTVRITIDVAFMTQILQLVTVSVHFYSSWPVNCL